MIRRTLFLTLLLAAWPSVQADSQPQLTAERTRVTETETVFTGSARLTHEDLILTADEITYRRDGKVAVARGHVILNRGDQRLLAEEIRYNVEDRGFEITKFRLGQFPYYAEGERAAGSDQRLELKGTRMFYGEESPFAPTIKASRVEYQSGVALRLGDASFGVGAPSVVPLPSFNQRLDGPFALSDFQAGGGFSSRLGAYLELNMEVPVADGIGLGADLAVYTKRGVMAGPSSTYDTFGKGDTGMAGMLHSGYINDQGTLGTDIWAEPVPADRGFVSWSHHQVFTPGLTLDGVVNYWSDSEITRDFRPLDFRSVQTPDTWLETAYAGENYIVSLFARAQPNEFHLMQERLPEVRFDGLPIELGGGVYHRFNASYAILREEDPDPASLTPATLRSDRADAYYALSRPIAPSDWLTFDPVAGGRVTHYDRAVGRDDYTRVLGEVGFDLEARASGTYSDVESDIWKVDGLRHLITPRLSYRYIPEADNGRAYIPAIDRRVFDTYLQPLGLGDRRNIDDLDATNTLRLGLDQTLQTRDPVYGSRDLAVLQFAADQHFDDVAGRRDLSDIHTALALAPARWITFDVYQRVTPQTGQLQELNTGVTIRDADIWSFRLSSHYLDDVVPINEYLSDYTLRLNELYRALIRLRYDVITDRLLQQTYALEQKLSPVWTVTYALDFRDGNRREGDFGVSVSIELTSF